LSVCSGRCCNSALKWCMFTSSCFMFRIIFPYIFKC
jgi:hypothetical protein